MSRSSEQAKSFLQFGNPFRMIFPKGSMSPKLLDLLNTFEETLAGKLKKLKPADKEDVLRLSWMKSSMESLCEIHADIKVLITALELPVCDWEDKWIDVYLDNSVKLLDICIAFSSEISRLKQGNLFLQCVTHKLADPSFDQFVQARSSMDGWRHHIGSKGSRLENCFSVMDSLAQTLHLPKIKNSSKGKVLMRAMYGVKVVTLYLCSVFAAAFSRSADRLMELQVTEACMWADSFIDLQNFVNIEIRTIYSSGRITILKDVEGVDMAMKKFDPKVLQNGVVLAADELFKKSTMELVKSVENLSNGLDLLAREVDNFFQIVLTGRDALLFNLRIGGDNIVPDRVWPNNNQDGQMVR